MSPDVFSNEANIDAFKKINAALASGRAEGALAETVFTLEAIKKKGRQLFLSTYKPSITIDEKELAAGRIQLSISIGPDRAAHPGNNSFLEKHWTDAERLGFKILRSSRIGGIVNPELKKESFVELTYDINERFGKCGRDVEAHGCGLAQLKSIGGKYAVTGEPWHHGIANAPDTEEVAISKAVAEWADGDAVAAHYAYDYEFICTRDIAKSGGQESVFATKNRKWLTEDYGVKFVTPEQLAEML